MENNEKSYPNANIDQLCLLIGQLTGKVEALVDSLSKNSKDLSTERARIDNIDRWRGGVSIVGPILAVVLPAVVGVAVATMNKPNYSAGLTYQEVEDLRGELRDLNEYRRKYKKHGEHFISPDRPERLEYDRP